MWSAIRTLAENIAQAHECDADVTITQGFPPTVNDARAVALAEAVATSLPHGEYMDLPAPIMGAEDFSYVLEKVPGHDGVPRRCGIGRRLVAVLLASIPAT